MSNHLAGRTVPFLAIHGIRIGTAATDRTDASPTRGALAVLALQRPILVRHGRREALRSAGTSANDGYAQLCHVASVIAWYGVALVPPLRSRPST